MQRGTKSSPIVDDAGTGELFSSIGVARVMRSLARLLPIADADFWRLWLIGFVLFTGRWLDMLAMSVYLFQRTGSAFLVSLIVLVRFLPLSLLGAFIGTMADRIDRWTLLLAMNMSMLLCAAVLAMLEHAGMLAIWHLFVASFLGGIVTTCDNPVRRLMMGEIVGSERFGKAISLDVASSNGTRTCGPFISGAVLAAYGIEEVFLIDAILYAAATVATVFIRNRTHVRPGAQESVLKRLQGAWDICRADPRLTGFLLLTMIFNLFVFPYVSMVPVIGASSLGLDAAQIGLLGSMDGAGSVIGAILIALLIRQANYQRLYATSIVAGHFAAIAFALAGTASLSGAALIILGVMVAGFAVTQSTLVFLLSPAHARARMMGLLSVAIGINPAGFLVIGVLADWIGPAQATAVMALTGLIVLFLARRHWLPVLRHVG